ncbi:MAG: PilZ domain-containing protein [Mariprofundus sp.]
MIEKKLKERLSTEFPALKPADHVDIARMMVGTAVKRSATELALALAGSKVDIGTLLSGLLRYEWMIIQDLMKSSESNNSNVPLHDFSLCIERFGKLQAAIVAAFEKSWSVELEKEISARVLAECNAQWLLTGYVHLHNYFNEMPVVAKAKYVGFGGEHLSVKMSPEIGRVFVSAEGDTREAVITSPDRRHNINVSVIDCHNDELKLVIRSVQFSTRECRENVRVKINKDVRLQVKLNNSVFPAKLIDLSALGLGFELVGDLTIRPGDQMTFAWMVDGHKITAEGTACWATSVAGGTRAGVKFKAQGTSNEEIRKFMFAQQQQLIGRLKQLGAPVWMKSR